MSHMKRHASGDNPPQHLPVFALGRFQLIHTLPGKVWITDTDSGEGGSFELSAVESAVRDFFGKEF